MKRNTKKTLLIGSTSLLAVVLGVTVISHSAANGGLFAYRAKATGGQVSGSIVFSRNTGSFKKIDSKTASISGTTSSGATYYAISHNNDDITNTNYVAQFGMGVAYDQQFVTFSDSANGGAHFEFQAITGIKVYTTSSSNQTFYLYYSTDGTTFSSYETVAGKSSPEKVTFETAHKYIKLCVTNVMDKFVTKIELFYDCSTEPAPEPEKTLSSISVESAKTIYAQNGIFVEPDVRAHYSDNTSELVSGALFTGFDSSSLTESQTISVSYEGKETSYQIKVRPTETSKKISYVGYDADEDADVSDLSVFLDLTNSTLPEYANSGSTVTITPAPGTGVSILDAFSYDADVVNNGDGTFSVTVGSIFDCEVTIVYRIPSVLTGIAVGDSTILEYEVGDEFVEPDVYEVYSNGNRVLIITDDVEFTGFDSSAACESQTITVTYGLLSTTYTISISESSGSEDVFQFATYEYATSATRANIYRFTFNSDGSASYERYQKNDTYPKGAVVGKINLTYTIVNGIITLTFDAFDQRETTGNPQTTSMSDFASYRLFNTGTPTKGVTNVTASYANGVVSIKLYNSSYVQNANATNFEIYNAE